MLCVTQTVNGVRGKSQDHIECMNHETIATYEKNITLQFFYIRCYLDIDINKGFC